MKLSIVIIAALLLFSCGNEKKSNLDAAKERLQKQAAANDDDGDACRYLSESLLKSILPGATNFEAKSTNVTYPTCSYKFDLSGKSAMARFTLAKGFGSEKNFDSAMNRFSDREPLEGIGDKAYYLPKLEQLSVWAGEDIFHVNINGDKELTIKAAKAIIDKL